MHHLPLTQPQPTLRTRRRAGFTLLELLVVISIIAIASVGVGFALRDGGQTQLEQEAQRLAALLESARGKSQARGAPVVWTPHAEGFRFSGLPATELPQTWLHTGTHVQGTPSVLLGPEPIIGAQEIVLESDDAPRFQVRITTDGVQPFHVQAARPS